MRERSRRRWEEGDEERRAGERRRRSFFGNRLGRSCSHDGAETHFSTLVAAIGSFGGWPSPQLRTRSHGPRRRSKAPRTGKPASTPASKARLLQIWQRQSGAGAAPHGSSVQLHLARRSSLQERGCRRRKGGGDNRCALCSSQPREGEIRAVLRPFVRDASVSARRKLSLAVARTLRVLACPALRTVFSDSSPRHLGLSASVLFADRTHLRRSPRLENSSVALRRTALSPPFSPQPRLSRQSRALLLLDAHRLQLSLPSPPPLDRSASFAASTSSFPPATTSPTLDHVHLEPLRPGQGPRPREGQHPGAAGRRRRQRRRRRQAQERSSRAAVEGRREARLVRRRGARCRAG